MTVVVAVVTPDGMVFASDSATTQSLPLVGGGVATSSIWNSANKIFNLRKCWPVGAMTFGRAAIQSRAIGTLAKELRLRLSGEVADAAVPKLDRDGYTVEEVADAVHTFFRGLYDDDPGGDLGFLVGGFGGAQQSPELWQILISDTIGDKVENVLPAGEAGIVHQGMTDAITRIIDGAGQGLGHALETMGVPAGQGEQFAEALRAQLNMDWAWPGMPLGESIDMARFLVDTQINFVRFMPGDAVVGGPIEIAALTKHEGFKWIQRKHYFSPELNPSEEVR